MMWLFQIKRVFFVGSLSVLGIFTSFVVESAVKEAWAEEAQEKISSSTNFKPFFIQGQKLLQSSSALSKHAQMNIQQGNSLRKQVIQLRQQGDVQKKGDLANTLLELSQSLQDEAASLRKISQQLQGQGLYSVRLGFGGLVQSMGKDISSSKLNYLKHQLTAHNQLLMSKKQNLISEQEEKNRNADSKALKLRDERLAEQSKPDDLDTHPVQVSLNQNYAAYFTGENQELPLNTIHTWLLIVTDLDGNPLSDLNITINGDMPGHNHGLPTSPKVVKSEVAGQYLVKGMKFQMPGWWVITFDVEREGETDQLRYNLEL